MNQESFDFLADLESRHENVQSNDAQVPPGERPCPICAEAMQVEEQYGMSIDVCPAHGMWLDRGELPAIVGRIRSGERINRHAAIRRAKKDGKMSGAFFGVWSLLLD